MQHSRNNCQCASTCTKITPSAIAVVPTFLSPIQEPSVSFRGVMAVVNRTSYFTSKQLHQSPSQQLTSHVSCKKLTNHAPIHSEIPWPGACFLVLPNSSISHHHQHTSYCYSPHQPLSRLTHNSSKQSRRYCSVQRCPQ